MLVHQACGQHAGDRKWHAVEITKNALNLRDFSNNSRNCSGSRWLISLAREVCRHRAGGRLTGMACNACGQADSPDRHPGGGACGRGDPSDWNARNVENSWINAIFLTILETVVYNYSGCFCLCVKKTLLWLLDKHPLGYCYWTAKTTIRDRSTWSGPPCGKLCGLKCPPASMHW